MLVFTDADCIPSANWISRLWSAHSNGNKKNLVSGSIKVIGSSNKPGIIELYDICLGLPQERYVARGYSVTANLAVPSAVFHVLNGFDESQFSGGDAELCLRAGRKGYRLVYDREAIVCHPARKSWKTLAQKAMRIKGAQLKRGNLAQRSVSIIKTLIPPVRGVYFALISNKVGLRSKVWIVMVLMSLWVVGIYEMVRLLLGGKTKRQ